MPTSYGFYDNISITKNALKIVSIQITLFSSSSSRQVTMVLFSECCNWREVGLFKLIREVIFALKPIMHEYELDSNLNPL